MRIALPRGLSIHSQRRSRHGSMIGGVALCISIVSASTFTGFAKILSGALSPLSLLFISDTIVALSIAFTLGIFPIVRELRSIKPKQRIALLLVGIISGAGAPFMAFLGIAHTTAINASFFGKFEIVAMVTLAHLILKENITRTHVAAVIAVLAGITTIALEGFQQHISLHSGDFFMLISASLYAAGTMIYRTKLPHVEGYVLLFTRSICAIAAFFLISPFLTHPFIDELLSFPFALLPALFGFALIPRLLNTLAFYQAIERLKVTVVSLTSSLDVIGATIFAILFIGESLEWYHVIGGLLIILGTILLEFAGVHPTEKHLRQHLQQRTAR